MFYDTEFHTLWAVTVDASTPSSPPTSLQLSFRVQVQVSVLPVLVQRCTYSLSRTWQNWGQTIAASLGAVSLLQFATRWRSPFADFREYPSSLSPDVSASPQKWDCTWY